MKGQDGMTRVELAGTLAVGALVGAIAAASTLLARMAAYEAAAIADVGAIIRANVAYAKANHGCYATTTVLLGDPLPDLGREPFVALILAQATPYTWQGYDHDYAGDPGPKACCIGEGVVCGDPGVFAYAYVANPITWNVTGARAFSGDHSGVICEQAATGVNWAANIAGTRPPCGTNGSTPISK